MRFAPNKPAVDHRLDTAGTGFTLVELIAVIAIIAVITVVTLPALKSFQSTALQTAVRQVASEMKLARQYAITQHTRVRFGLCVSTSNMPAGGSNHVARAYVILAVTNNVDNIPLGWVTIQDWKFLPNGVVFSDHNASGTYNPLNADAPPPEGTIENRLTATTSSPPVGSEWQYYTNVATTTNFVPGATNIWSLSSVDFLPTGAVANLGGGGAAGAVRLAQGVVINPATPTLLVNSSNNWAYIEYDRVRGRVRTRYPDSYN